MKRRRVRSGFGAEENLLLVELLLRTGPRPQNAWPPSTSSQARGMHLGG